MELKGLTIENILQMDPYQISRLNRQELAQITSRLVSASNKRLRRAKPTEQGVFSPAVLKMAEAKGITIEQLEQGIRPQFSIKDEKFKGPQGVNNLREAFKEMRRFLNSKTSTAKGFKEYRKKIEKELGPVITSDKDLENAFWDAYNRFMIDDHMGEIFKSKDNDGNYTIIEWLREYSETNQIYDKDSLYKALRAEIRREDIDNEERFEGITITPEEVEDIWRNTQ